MTGNTRHIFNIAAIIAICCILISVLFWCSHKLSESIETNENTIPTEIDSISTVNRTIIIHIENLDSIKNEKVIEVKSLDNDSTLKLFYELIRK